jgi:hypothetical protein
MDDPLVVIALLKVNNIKLYFPPSKPILPSSSTIIITQDVCECRSRMAENKLMLNDDKTEVMVFGSKHNLEKFHFPGLSVGNELIVPNPKPVQNLGVLFDSGCTIEAHVQSICKVANFHIRCIGSLWGYLTQETTERVVHAVVTSRPTSTPEHSDLKTNICW